MSHCITPSPTDMASNNENKQHQHQQRLFSPIVLFHDHRFVKDGDFEHIHIPYKEPHLIESHKKRIDQMLQDNGRFWADVMIACTKEKEKPLSPVPSLVSSSPPSPHWSSSSSPPPRYPSRNRRTTFPSSMTSARQQGSKSMSATDAAIPPPAAASTTPIPAHRLLHQHHRHHHLQRNNTTLVGGADKKRQRNNLPKPVTAILKAWLAKHKKHPYPNEDEKCQLVRQTGLARNQISNWFINARRRILRPMLMEEDEDEEDEDDEYVKWRPAAKSSNRCGVSLT
ncbi:hypothetical protein BX666DRAFT_1917472 [Dichotomocladium elegans]|nr:hypothetical protein BX666DRAFT_1917472 [Dichotomocladium elegans]